MTVKYRVHISRTFHAHVDVDVFEARAFEDRKRDAWESIEKKGLLPAFDGYTDGADEPNFEYMSPLCVHCGDEIWRNDKCNCAGARKEQAAALLQQSLLLREQARKLEGGC